MLTLNGPHPAAATCPPEPLPTTGPCSFNPDMVELPYAGTDYNNNGVDDAIDIMTGTSADLNGNGIPEEAENCQGPQVTSKPLSWRRIGDSLTPTRRGFRNASTAPLAEAGSSA